MATCSRCGAQLDAGATACSMCGMTAEHGPAIAAEPPSEPALPAEPMTAAEPAPPPLPPLPPEPVGSPLSAPAPEPAPPPAAPAWVPCWRCGAPLYPEFRLCPTCGLATGFAPAPRRRSRLPLIVGLMAVVLLATVGAFVVFYHGDGWEPGAEPAPAGSWEAFTPPDGSWTMSFPGPLAPMKLSQSIEAGGASVQITMFVASSEGGAYEAGTADLPSYLAAELENESRLDDVGSQMFGSLGEVKASRTLTVAGHSAREVKLTISKMDGYCRFFVVGNRMYLLMVMGAPGTTLYPEHFFDSFTMK